jgi:hypothetical protein
VVPGVSGIHGLSTWAVKPGFVFVATGFGAAALLPHAAIPAAVNATIGMLCFPVIPNSSLGWPRRYVGTAERTVRASAVTPAA